MKKTALKIMSLIFVLLVSFTLLAACGDDEKTTEVPTGGQIENPTGGKPTGEQPTGEKNTGEEQTDEQPTGNPPSPPVCQHVEEIVPAKAPTCTDKGLKEGKVCSVCGETLVAQEEVPATGHTEVIDEAKAPTCTETGLTEGKHCSVCGLVLAEQTTVNAKHNYINYVCTVCGDEIIPSQGLAFTSNGDGTCYVSGIGDCTDTDIVIPSKSPDGDSVTGIGDQAFFGFGNIASIFIPDSVTSIVVGALCCVDLSLWEDGALISNLTNIKVGENNAAYKSINGDLYSKDGKTLIQYAVGKTDKTFAIPSNVTSIGIGAFGYCDKLTGVVIPDSVTIIGDMAFAICINLEDIVIPDGVENIGYGMFNRCDNLASVVIGNGVTSIGEDVFCKCSNLTSVVIGDSVTSIGESAFYGCSSLISVVIPNSVTSIEDRAFIGCSSLTSIEIPDSVMSIGYLAFGDCYKLVEVVNKSSLNIVAGSEDNGKVAYYAKEVHDGNSKILNVNDYLFYTHDGINYLFGYAGNDTELVLPENYNGQEYEIYQYAFYKNNKITSIVIPDRVTGIGKYAFYYCDSLTSIEIHDSITSIDSSAFLWCPIEKASIPTTAISSIKNYDLKTVTITSGTSIGDRAFYGCSSLESVVISDSVTDIGAGAFWDCSSLTRVVIPDSVVSIGTGAFIECNNLKEVCISSIEAWCKISFGGIYANPLECTHNLYLNEELVTELVIPDGVTSIGDSAFRDYSSLTSIVIPDSVTSIGDSAFRNCNNLTSIVIPGSVTSIGNYAFDGCSSLTSLTVSENNTEYKSIDGNLYSKDGKTLIWYTMGKKDTSFTIPDGVTSIGDYAFQNCSNLTSIVISDSVTSIGDYAFQNCSNLRSIEIPDDVTRIDRGAFFDCINLTSVKISHSVTEIDAYAFSGCSSLTSVEYKGTKAMWEEIRKGGNWNYNTGSYVIHCTDGDIEK